jgi:cytochrome c oxidase subunit I+III
MQVFGWIATLARGRVRFDTQTLFVLGFLFTFVLGGLTGVMVAALPFDWQVHDTYFVVAHFHYVLIGGTVFPLLAALYHWLPLEGGRRLDERRGRWVFGLVFGGFHLAFFPMHVAGLLGMPRRIYTYPAGLGWEWPNALSSLGALAIAAGFGLLLVDLVRASRQPKREHANPWNAPTLEWLPSAEYGLRSIPQIAAREPLWQRPGLLEEVRRGGHWLPGTATGRRETLVTGARRADLRHLIVLPGPSWLPLLAAFGTAAYFLLLTVKWVWTAHAFGALAIACVLAWLWQTDRLPAATSAEIGRGVRVPVGASGTASHSWWATAILVVVDLTIFASMAFAHIHLAMASDVCPPPGAALPPWPLLLAACGGFALSAAAVVWSGRPLARRPAGALRTAFALLGAAGLATAAFVALLLAHLDAGLLPKAQAWSASVAALLGYVGVHVVLLGICALYLIARAHAGLLTPRQRASHDNCALLWWCACAEGVAVALLPHAVAAAMR